MCRGAPVLARSGPRTPDRARTCTRARAIAEAKVIRPAALIAVLAFGCGSTEKHVTMLELRAAVIKADIRSMPPETRTALMRGDVWVGASETDVYLARGEPRLWWNTRLGTKWCRVLVHGKLTDPRTADTSVTTCDGAVIAVGPIVPALPCWRLTEVGPRISAQAQYFDGLAYKRQWQIVAGILERGQGPIDIEIAFGKPYSRGFDEREDGSRADKQVFLDHGGNAYGLTITLVAGKVAAWSMPAERRLTPEAEQRRLDAMEQRLQAKLAELEALSKKQHEETVELFGEVMDQKESMLSTLAAPLAAAAGVAAGNLTAPGEMEETSEASVDEANSGSVKVKEEGNTKSIEFDQTKSKKTKSKTVKKRKR